MTAPNLRIVIFYLWYLLVRGCANVLLLTIVSLSWRGSALGAMLLCPNILVEGQLDPPLSEVERRLICGDSKGSGPSARAWRSIPFSQARYHLQTFIQDRGLYHPVFKQSEDKILVDLGFPTFVTEIKTEGAPQGLMIDRKRGVIGQKLTPLILSELEQWMYGRLQEEGYPCPEVKSEADPDTGLVLLYLQTGQKLPIVAIKEEPIVGIAPGMLRRYDAFQLHGPFNGNFVTLTERRILSQGSVQSAHFRFQCNPAGVVIIQDTTAGAPRLLSFGFGVNTEGLFLAKTSWKNTRLGLSASLLDVTGIASTKQQILNASLNWYHFPHQSRRSIKPVLELRHENEDPYELISARFQIAPETSMDTHKVGVSARVGPAWDVIRTLRGSGAGSTQFVSLDSEIRLLTHYYEFFRGSPRSGVAAVLSTSFNSDAFLSDVTAQRIRLTGEGLWNFREYDPPLFVLGIRSGFATTLIGDELNASFRLPPNFRHYLGGSLDLRGFGRNELSAGGSGGLSSMFAGLELRFDTSLPLGLQPFLFTDAGALGAESFNFDAPVFWSPGVGIRWESPVGVFRTTLAHGFVAGDGLSDSQQDEFSHLQFYFSFGEEF